VDLGQRVDEVERDGAQQLELALANLAVGERAVCAAAARLRRAKRRGPMAKKIGNRSKRKLSNRAKVKRRALKRHRRRHQGATRR
jgi:hypothetical protein